MREFLLKGIFEQTIVQVFFKDMLIVKKQSNIDSLKISFTVRHYILGQIVSPEKPSIELNVM